MATKSLVTDVRSNVPNGSQDKWNVLGNITDFINSITTPALSEHADMGTIVSGFPTAFARVDLFRAAFDAMNADRRNVTTEKNLMSYYQELVDEWRGFLACIALDYPNIRVKKINLVYSDGQKITNTNNIYEPAGAFGNMLLERRDRWREQGKAQNEDNPPFLNLIKYHGKVVGATSPESLLFTSSAYRLDPDPASPWIDREKRRFTDPLKSNLSADEATKLLAYVRHIIEKLPEVEGYYDKRFKVEYSSIRLNLERWVDEIQDYIRNRSQELPSSAIPAVDVEFFGPFGQLFCHEDELYGVEGVITEGAQNPDAQKFNPKSLLLPSSARIARIELGKEYADNPSRLNDFPVFLLKAEKKGMPGQYAFFSLPLSPKGLNIYGKSIGPLVGMTQDRTVDSSITAVYDPVALEDNLEVDLAIKTENGKVRHYHQHYTVGSEGLRNKDILLWPNFISKQWNHYYLYSELPHNNTQQTYNAFPFVGDPNDQYFQIITDEHDEPILLANNGEITAPSRTVDARLLLSSGNAVSDNAYKYEIYRSDKPFKGVKLVAPTGEDGGYLIVNYSSDVNSRLPHNLLSTPSNLEEVTLGIDFGSTNTSVAYSLANGTPQGFDFTNQRVSLFGQDRNDGADRDAKNPGVIKENRILFFQGRDVPLHSNDLHSVLTLHDERRMRPLKSNESNIMRAAEEVVGGFPCFMDNLPVHNVTPETITLKYPRINFVTQIHNMKWNDLDIEKSHKKAYLRTLLLHIYAEMFRMNKVPTALRWSYPSSMSNYLVTQYQSIWDSLESLKPVLNPDLQSYNLRISKFPGSLTFNQESVFGQGMPSGFGGGQNPFGSFTPADGGFGASSPFGGSSPFGAAPQGAPAQGGFGAPQSNGPAGFQSNAPESLGAFNQGNQPAAQAMEEFPNLMPDDPNRITKYNPQPLFKDQSANISLTEANSVANFMSSQYGDNAQTIILTFDIGGSTTDISALYKLRSGLTMIKQNSIRFAAQRVSGATSYVPKFKEALIQTCHECGIDILGLTKGDNRFSADTAPYYFGQIVDRLTEEQLPGFYRLISTTCPQLFWVNMYVTGLLMYYGGQIAYKLAEDIYRADPNEIIPGTNQRPVIYVTFAGKGSRLLQWLSTTYPDRAKDYYFQLFVQGFGGPQTVQSVLGNWPAIMLPDTQNSVNIKYEVSKGLAKNNTNLFNPKDNTPSEIIGEAGFTVTSNDGQAHQLSVTNSITPQMIEYIGSIFRPDNGNPCSKFQDFCGIFYNAAKQLFDMNISIQTFEEGFRNMNIVQYIQSCPEYIQAQSEKSANNNKFGFVAPIIILEGMKFYDNYLLNALKPQ